MTKDPVTIEELDIVRAPGFTSEGFSVDGVSDGINIVHGPNAAGKTTIARCIEWLFWPDSADTHATVNGNLSLNGEAWRVELHNGHPSYQQDGQDANGPNLPPTDHRDRYRLSLHDLLQQETQNETFAETIERESAGGYDLSAARYTLGYDDSPSTRGKSVVHEAEQAVEELRDAQSAARELEQEQNRLSTLRDELQEASQAQQQVELLNQAIDYAQARDDLKAAEAELDTFPDVLEDVDGDEADEAAQIEEEIEEWREKREAANDRKNDAKADLDEADLPDEGLSAGFIDRLKERRDTWETLEGKKADLTAELAAAKEKRDKIQQEIPLDVDQDALKELDPVSWKDISKFARTAEEVQAARTSRDAIEDWVANAERPATSRSTLDRGAQALEEWLSAPTPTENETSNEAFRIALVSGVLLSLAGIALGAFVHPVLFSLILVGIGILWYGYQTRTTTSETNDPWASYRDSYQQTGLEDPDSWTVDGVRDRLLELYDLIAQHEVAAERTQVGDTFTTQQNLEEQERDLEDKRSTLRDQLGAAPETTDIELTVITKRVLDWQAAHDEVVRLETELDEVTTQLADARTEFESDIEPYGYDDVEDHAEATEKLRNLEAREDTRETAQETLDRATDTIAEADEKVEALESEWDNIFTALDLEPGDYDELESLCEQVDDYNEAKSSKESAQVLAENEAEDLEAMPDYDPALKEREVSALEAERDNAQATAETYDEVHGDITEIETKIEEAKQDDAVETAITEKDRALDALSEQLDDDYAAMVGDVLVDHVQDRTVEASRPPVFQRAREILTTITRGRYRLDFDEASTSFRATDTAKQKGFALDELSSGTRVQVLLAVRIAFVEQQEQSVKLPLLLDETLANSDDLRADVIIESMIELARSGRQIFYFTAQGDEVAKWLDTLDDIDDINHSVIDLADVRNLDRTIHIPDLNEITAVSPDPPSPDGHDHILYGTAIDVPPFNPHRGAGTAHLWYLIEDVAVLHRFLELGIDCWGQLQNLLERGNGDLIIEDSDCLDEIQQNAAALEAFVQAWKVGRGEPVDRHVLEASGAVSNTFIDEVTELATEVNGSAESIIEALRDGEVHNWRSGKTGELEAYFRDNGYLESRDTLNDDQIRLRVIEQFIENGVPEDEAHEKTTALLTRITTPAEQEPASPSN
jgi:uncharacterized protein YhaN